MRKPARKIVIMLLSISVFTAGCATAPVVQPTYEELEAARPFKKTVAVIEFNDDASPVKGVKSMAFSKLENLLVGHFNLVEREKVREVLEERDFRYADSVENIGELGKLLGADCLIFGNTVVSISGPEARHSESTYEGRFSGSIWDEYRVRGEVSIKIVDVESGMVLYSDTKNGAWWQRDSEDYFTNEQSFREALKARSIGSQAKRITDSAGGLNKEYSFMSAQALEMAVERFNYDLRNRFAQSGEVLEILSGNEVTVNLGSAYGIRPGDKLIMWEEMEPIKDPKTGMVTVPKEKKLTLKVTKVTSGLTCVAKGSKKDVSRISVGDKVYTH